jgi:aminopeptidase N
MTGFYRAKYAAASLEFGSAIGDSKDSYVLVTHFEPSNARQAFPCFDEPNLKARFQLEIELPERQEVLSNTSVRSTWAGEQPGMKRVLFEKTPVMSTYVSPPLHLHCIH